MDRLDRSAPLCVISTREGSPAADGQLPLYTRAAHTLAVTLWPLQAALALVPATDASHHGWRCCHGPPPHPCTMKASRRPFPCIICSMFPMQINVARL